MKNIHLVFSLLIVCFFLSCTVEKRLYNKGFHIEWKKKYQASRASNEVSSTDLKNVEQDKPLAESDLELLPVVSNELMIPDSTLIGENEIEQEIVQNVPTKDTIHVYEEKASSEPVGVASAISLLAALVFSRIPIQQFALFGWLLFPIAFILSIVSLIRFAYNRNRYDTNILGVITFVLCLVGIVIAVVLIALLLAF